MTTPLLSTGFVIWITGLSGVGKTTTAAHLVVRLREQGRGVVHLDGDDIRRTLPENVTGYTKDDRLKLARHYVGLAKLLYDQGFVVVVSTVSLFHSIHDLNRTLFARYLEVLISAPFEVLKRRDTRTVYQASSGIPAVGVDIVPELPFRPDVLHLNSHRVGPEERARRVLEAFLGVT